ncbi:MAG: PD40 domain-containing protein [Candidatus Aminicenantes bacterium]|nr:PD40 domain-containing protein [Candidatus Aminicenantes bacterium]
MKRNIIAFLMFGLLSIALRAQFENFGSQNPPGIKWKKIETLHFEIVFPEELTHEGRRVANTLEYLFPLLTKTLHKEPKRITILLSNQNSISNGYVTLAPRMSEFFHVPIGSYIMGINDWYHLLAVHEGRHIVQFDKINQGFTKIAQYLCGDIGRAAFSVISTPYWFMEGDAVGIETALTNGGRGRLPSFDMDIRALLLSGIRYSYYKAYLRSLKDWYPSWYPLGYLLTTYVKRTYGPGVWSEVLDRASKHAYSPYAFSNALKKETGMGVVDLYEKTMDDLEDLWKKQLEGLTFTPFQTKNLTPRKVWTNYMFPRYDTDGTIYAQKFGLAHPSMLVRLNPDGTEEKITQFAPLQGFYNRLSLKNGKATWNEYIPDPRWGKRSYSDIVIYDIRNGKTERITHKAKLFDPSLSPDGTVISTVEFTPESRCALVILEAETGKEIKRLSNPKNDLIFSPSWSENGERIVFTRQNSNGRALSIAEIKTGEIEDVITYGWENITFPVLHKYYVFYNSCFSGIDNIYALDTRTGERFQITSSKFGAFFPEISPDGKKLLYSNYTVNGYDAGETSLDPASWKKLKDIEDRSLRYYQPLIAQEQGKSVFDGEKIPNTEYEVKNYHSVSHLLNIHSWVPMVTPTDISFDLISQDKMNLALLVGGLRYNMNEKVLGFGINGSYAGFFPILDFGVSHGGRSSTTTGENEEKTTTSWRETSANIGFRIPFDISRGIYSTSFTLGSGISLVNISGREFTEPFENGNGRLLPMSYRLSFRRFCQSSFRDINPTWGQFLNLAYRHTPWKCDYKASLFSANIGLYLPGLFKHHSLYIQGSHEKQLPDNYHFPSEILFPRGYDYTYHNSITKASVDYALPLAYPDFALGSILYLKRLRMNLFYDYALGRDTNSETTYQSVGIDLVADINLFVLPFDLDIGSRLVYRISDNKFRIGFLFLGFSF